jgi:four helix bundle protein
MQDLKQRTFLFTVSTGKLIGELSFNTINRACFNQIVKCSSSIGANYGAAKRAKSDADFLNKLKIVEEDADETIYFHELLLEFNPDYQQNISY